MPFGDLKTRMGTIKTLSYLGDRDYVYSLMQRISHRSRTFIVSSKGLKPFLTIWFKEIQDLETNGKLESVAKHQHVDIQ